MWTLYWRNCGFDAIINACKLKTHMLCRITNAIKNAFGIVPGLGKSVIHSYAPGPRDLAEQVVNVWSQTCWVWVPRGLISPGPGAHGPEPLCPVPMLSRAVPGKRD